MVLTKIRNFYKKKKIQKCIFALESAFEKIGSPPYSQKLNFIVYGTLVTRNQRKKPEFNPSYGYGAMSINASDACIRAHLVHCRTLLLIAT